MAAVEPPRAAGETVASREGVAVAKDGGAWLRALRVYLPAILVGNLAWEAAHLPLYTLWRTGTAGEQIFAVLHCTGGDLLIALSALAVALLVAGDGAWPAVGHRRVAGLAVAGGVAYTAFSEWLNVEVRRSWAYAESMPLLVLPGGFELGLSPVLQWLVVPTAALWLARRRALRPRGGGETPAPRPIR